MKSTLCFSVGIILGAIYGAALTAAIWQTITLADAYGFLWIPAALMTMVLIVSGVVVVCHASDMEDAGN